MSEIIQALEQKTAIQILLYLLTKEKDNVTSILRSGKIKGGQTAIYTALKKLEEAELVLNQQWTERSLRIISLTVKGQKIAQQLQKIITE